jgi:hypothetical protein
MSEAYALNGAVYVYVNSPHPGTSTSKLSRT